MTPCLCGRAEPGVHGPNHCGWWVEMGEEPLTYVKDLEARVKELEADAQDWAEAGANSIEALEARVKEYEDNVDAFVLTGGADASWKARAEAAEKKAARLEDRLNDIKDEAAVEMHFEEERRKDLEAKLAEAEKELKEIREVDYKLSMELEKADELRRWIQSNMTVFPCDMKDCKFIGRNKRALASHFRGHHIGQARRAQEAKE